MINNNQKMVKSTTENWELSNAKKFLDSVFIDDSFQSPARWDATKSRSYLHNLLKGIAPSKFIFADVPECRKSAMLAEDINYYSGWLSKGANYLNLDSNNRFTTFRLLFTNQLELRAGTYSDELDNKFTIKRDQRWADLSESVKDFILTRTITVQVYTNATRSQLSDIFIAVNSGCELNAAEKRNAIISPISKICREFGERYYRDFTTRSWILSIFSEQDYNRRKIDSQFAGMAFFHSFGFKKNISDGILRSEYEDGSELNSKSSLFKNDVDNFFNTWVAPNEDVFKDGMKLSKQTVFDLFVFYHRHRNQIKDVKTFMYKFVEINALLKKNPEADHKVGDKKMTYAALLRGRETPKCQKRYELLSNGLVKSKVMTDENVTAVYKYKTKINTVSA
jgi:hypothetical protein